MLAERALLSALFCSALVAWAVWRHFGFPRIKLGKIFGRIVGSLFPALAMATVISLAISPMAHAEKREYTAFSNQQADEIRTTIRAEPDYRHGVLIHMKDKPCEGTLIQCWISAPREYTEYMVYTNKRIYLPGISWLPALEAAERVQKKIQQIINPQKK
jgi:hypothetical protein